MNKNLLFFLALMLSCSSDNDTQNVVDDNPAAQLRSEVIVENNIFKVSYNELKEQANWIEYKVRDITKVCDRAGMNWYTEPNVHTSDEADYRNNEWDRAHLAPAGAFTDSCANLYQTFSFLNCTLQIDDLNQGEWAQLESQVRTWASQYGTLDVRIELSFSDNSLVLESGATVPDGYFKFITFPDDTERCFYFENLPTNMNWDQYEITCN
tara:strand:- start:12 stop:641 length:630 start_codon:yes stop_codon:yes gene_type:complete